jgi:hypothetical protein
MKIREDLKDEEAMVSRLLSYGNQFRENDQPWSHYANKEDWHKVYNLPLGTERNNIELVYSKGRDMAYDMRSELAAINTDFINYPTMTKIVDEFQSTWIDEDNQKTVRDARHAADELNFNNWAFNAMLKLFEDQIKLIESVRNTLKTLRESNLYKRENGMEDNKAQTIITGNSGNIAIGNSGQTSQSIKEDEEVFTRLIDAIQKSNVESSALLVDAVREMAKEGKSDNSEQRLMNFLRVAQDQWSIVSPYVPALLKNIGL